MVASLTLNTSFAAKSMTILQLHKASERLNHA